MTSCKTGSSPSGSPGPPCIFTLFLMFCSCMFHFIYNFHPIWIIEFHASFYFPKVVQKLLQTRKGLRNKAVFWPPSLCWHTLLKAVPGDAVLGFPVSLSHVWISSCFDLGRFWQVLSFTGNKSEAWHFLLLQHCWRVVCWAWWNENVVQMLVRYIATDVPSCWPLHREDSENSCFGLILSISQLQVFYPCDQPRFPRLLYCTLWIIIC